MKKETIHFIKKMTHSMSDSVWRFLEIEVKEIQKWKQSKIQKSDQNLQTIHAKNKLSTMKILQLIIFTSVKIILK